MCDGMISSYCDGTCAHPQPQPTEHPADLPVATDSTTGCGHRFPDGVLCTLSDEAHEMPGMKHHAPAPEPSDRAGLSETERASVCPTCTILPGMAHDPSQDMGCAWTESVITAVERILADRLAVAEQERDEAEAKGHEAFKIGVAHQEARQAAERARDKAQRQLDIVSAQAVQIRDEREFRIRERNRAEARADAAEQEAATLRAQVAAVEALHGKTHWCFGGDLNDLRDDKVYEPGTEHWACPTLAALGDPGPWVDRLKTEGTEAAAALVEAEVESEVKRLTDAFGGDPLKSPMLNNWLGGMWTAAKVLRERARVLRDGGE